MIGWISNFGAAVIREVRGVGKFGLFSVQVLRKLAGARGRASRGFSWASFWACRATTCW